MLHRNTGSERVMIALSKWREQLLFYFFSMVLTSCRSGLGWHGSETFSGPSLPLLVFSRRSILQRLACLLAR